MAAKRSESLEDMEDAHLHCRDYRHWWQHVNDKVTDATRAGRAIEITRWRVCRNCGTELEERFSMPSCDITYRHYHYPDGYLLAQGVLERGQRVDVRDVRRAVFGRAGIKF